MYSGIWGPWIGRVSLCSVETRRFWSGPAGIGTIPAVAALDTLTVSDESTSYGPGLKLAQTILEESDLPGSGARPGGGFPEGRVDRGRRRAGSHPGLW